MTDLPSLNDFGSVGFQPLLSRALSRLTFTEVRYIYDRTRVLPPLSNS